MQGNFFWRWTAKQHVSKNQGYFYVCTMYLVYYRDQQMHNLYIYIYIIIYKS